MRTLRGLMRPMPLSTSQALSNRSSAPPLSAEQRRTQISDGHRLIRLARQKRLALYGEAEFLARCAYIDADYFMNRFIPVLLAKISDGVTVRVNAAIVRARRQAALYDVKKVGVAEYVAEAFYDSHLYNAREAHLPRPMLRDQIKATIHKGEALELLFPIFSRKPFSPIRESRPASGPCRDCLAGALHRSGPGSQYPLSDRLPPDSLGRWIEI